MPEDSGDNVKQLCYKVISLNESDPDFQPALQELRNAIHDSMTHAAAVSDSGALHPEAGRSG
jgi:hypothetical protein